MIKKRLRNLTAVVVTMTMLGTNFVFSGYIEVAEDNHKQPPIIEGIGECEEGCDCPDCIGMGYIEDTEDDDNQEDFGQDSDYSEEESDWQEDIEEEEEEEDCQGKKDCNCDDCREDWQEDKGCECDDCEETCGDNCNCEFDEYEEEPVLSNEELSIKAGNSKKIEILGEYDEVEWKSNDEAIATVNKNGKVTGIKSGEVTITAHVTCYSYEMDTEDTDEYDSVEEEYNEITDDLYNWGMNDETWDGEEELIPITYELECEITVKGGTISHKQTKLKVGKSKTLKIKGAKGKVKWTSSNNAVCTVKKGKLKAKKAGKTIITAKVAGAKFQCKVTVKKK